ncbi:outer membrane protein OmpK [Corallincola platygyrae]|uniref:Outer membrane protein OmpK n=1 Tax=Corallincola platygyrae TaxID=1193278 RepID=A0ABW4XL07_9GAMM
MNYKAALCGAALVFAAPASAEDFFFWSDTSLTLLHGTNFEVNAEDQTTVTFEHVNGHKYGDFFMFYDYITYHDSPDNDAQYGEISPRFSASKISGNDMSFGIVTDVLATFTYEFGKGDVESVLYGPAVDLALPGFDFFQLNLYKRDPNNNDSEGWQLTPVWKVTFPVGQSELVVDGFIDWVFKSDNDNYEENLHINPQIKYDLGMSLWGEESKGQLYIGIEYDYWSNKYGLSDDLPIEVDQKDAVSAIVKYHF